MAEVRRCELFLGLMGDKYGWVAPEEVRRPVIASAGLVEQPGLPLSVTAIELLTAAGLEGRTTEPIFLRRRITTLDRAVAAAQLGVTFDDRPDLVDALQCELESRNALVHTYSARWSSARRQLELDAFTDLATEVIWRQVQRLVMQLAESTWLERELAGQRAYAAALANPPLGREQALQTFREFLEWPTFEGVEFFPTVPQDHLSIHEQFELKRPEPDTLALVGEPGVGLSTLVAELTRAPKRWMFDPNGWLDEEGGRESGRVCAVVHVAATKFSRRRAVGLLLMLAQLDLSEAQRIARTTNPVALTEDQVLPAWQAAVQRLPVMGKAIIAVDGLDHFQDAPHPAQIWSWFPQMTGQRAVFVLSAVEGSRRAKLLAARPNTTVHSVGPLNDEDARVLVRNIATSHNRTLSPRVTGALVQRSTNPAWLALVTDLLLTMTGQQYRLLTSPALLGIDSEDQLERLLLLEVERLSVTPTGLEFEIIARLTQMLGTDVRVALALLSLSIGGVREPDLVSVVAQHFQAFEETDLAATRRLLGRSLHSDGAELWIGNESLTVELTSWAMGDGAEVMAPLVEAFHSHLLELAVEDDLRVRNLLPVLLILGEHAQFAAALADPEATSEAYLETLVTSLYQVKTPAPELLREVLRACSTDAERLEVCRIWASVAQFQEPNSGAELRAIVLRELASMPEATDGRDRGTSGELAEYLLFTNESMGETVRERLSHMLEEPGLGLEEHLASKPGTSRVQELAAVYQGLWFAFGYLYAKLSYDDSVHPLSLSDVRAVSRLLHDADNMRTVMPDAAFAAISALRAAVGRLLALTSQEQSEGAISAQRLADSLAAEFQQDLSVALAVSALYRTLALEHTVKLSALPTTVEDLRDLILARSLLLKAWWLLRVQTEVVPPWTPLKAAWLGVTFEVVSLLGEMMPGDAARVGLDFCRNTDYVDALDLQVWLWLASASLMCSSAVERRQDCSPVVRKLLEATAEIRPQSMSAGEWDPSFEADILEAALAGGIQSLADAQDPEVLPDALSQLLNPRLGQQVDRDDVASSTLTELRPYEELWALWDADDGWVPAEGMSPFDYGREFARGWLQRDVSDPEFEPMRRSFESVARARFQLFLHGTTSAENLISLAFDEFLALLAGATSPFEGDPKSAELRDSFQSQSQSRNMAARERHLLAVMAGILTEIHADEE